MHGDQMKISKKIIGTFAVILTAACGIEVDQKDIHKISEGNSSQPLGEGFDLSGTDVSSIGSGANLNASSNLLECAPGAAGDGIVTNTTNYDLTGGEVTIKIDLTNTNPGHSEKISLISSTGDDYHFTIFDAGGYGYQAKASKNSDGFNWHRDFGVGNSVGYLRFKHDTTFNQMRLGFSTTGTFDPAIYMPYSVTSPTNFKLEFRCDDTLGSKISDLVINSNQLDLNLGGGTPPPPPSGNVLQAEDGVMSNGSVSTVWTDYTGTGFMDFTHYTGKVTWSGLNYPAGDYEITLRYGDGVSRRVALRINGNVVTEYPLAVQTGSWANWSTETQTITATSTITSITVDANNLSWGPNLDKIEINPVGGGAATTPYASHSIPGKIEFENFDNPGTAASYHDTSAGNTGGQQRTGENVDIEMASEGTYNVGWTAAGEWMLYTLSGNAAAGNYDLKIRHAGLSTGTIRVTVGGTALPNISLPASGGWQNWMTTTVNVDIPSSNQVRVDLLSGGFNLNYMEFTSAGASGPGPGSGPYTLNDPAQNQYLAYVESYIDSQTRTSNYGEHRVRTYDQNDQTNGFYWGTDTYDNALSSIFFTVIGKPAKAAKILDSWIRMQNWQIQTGQERGPLFWARMRYDNNDVIWNVDSGGQFLDTGNNSMMALAMCRYYQQFKDDAPSASAHLGYYNAAKLIMTEIHNNFRCDQGTYRGYMGRPTSVGDPGFARWLSVEHNLDMFALGACMEDAALTAEPGVNTIADDVQSVAGTFVSQMWDGSEGAYRVGTGECSSTNTTNEDYKPVDGITWRHLSKAESSPSNHNARSAASMSTLVTEQFLVLDSGFTGLIGTNYWGTKFSDAGWENQYANPKPAILSYGAQQENTGAALIALNDYHGNNYNADLEKIRTGAKAMLQYYGNQGLGIPAHFDADISACAGWPSRDYCNTGLTWSYQRVPHTAATAYFGFAMLYQFSHNGTIIPGANPYHPRTSEVVLQEAVPMPDH